MAKYVLALDQGTTSSRAIVFNHDGAIVSTSQQEFPQIYPAPGLVEHDPEAIWSSQLAVAREAMRQAGVSAADIIDLDYGPGNIYHHTSQDTMDKLSPQSLQTVGAVTLYYLSEFAFR